MNSRITFWTNCVLFFVTCIPQGHTRRRQGIKVEGIIESGSNITDLLQKIFFQVDGATANVTQPPAEFVEGGWKKTVQNAVLENVFGIKKVQITENAKPSGPSGLWSAAESLISNLAVALANNPDGQAIVQPSIDSKQYSLLQDMRSGRIRGPVHVYGRHAGRSEESSDSD